MTSQYRLISIPPSHYCEKARWALELAELPYHEERHPPLFHRRAVKKAGGVSSTPVLVADDHVMPDSTDILIFIHQHPSSAWRPYLADSRLLAEAEELEEHFDTRLGPHTRRLAYFYLLQYPDLFLRSVLEGVGGVESRMFRTFRRPISWLMRKGMNITPSSAERSLNYVREAFAGVDERLSDGRQYLVGGALSAADVTFASLAAPVLLPRNYGSDLPALDEVPDELLGLIEEFRSSVAGEFALRLYRDHR